VSPVTHLLVGWTVAQTAQLDRRERAIVCLAGVIPDLDGAGLLAEILTRNSPHPLTWWSDYHHVLGHNLGFALIVTALAFAFGRRRAVTTGLAALSFHLHLLCDLVGARGPDGYQWPLPYLLPFSNVWNLTWSGQWALNAWPNLMLTFVLLGLALYWAWQRGHSPVELISRRADRAVIDALRQRFGTPRLNAGPTSS